MAERVDTLLGPVWVCDGEWFFTADQTTNTVVSIGYDSIQITLEDGEITISLEGGS